MPAKRFFTKNKERVGKKSGKPRGKYKKRAQSIQENILVVAQPIQKPLKTQELPNINRSITDRFQRIGLVVFSLIVIGASVWPTIMIVEKSITLAKIVASRQKLSDEMQSWDTIAKQYPNYRDAYFQAAILAYQLGDSVKETSYLNKVLAIDPNYVPAKNLEKLQ